MVEKLRGQILEMESGSGGGVSGGVSAQVGAASGGITKKEKQTIETNGSSNTSVTSMTCGENDSPHLSPVSADAEGDNASGEGDAADGVKNDATAPSSSSCSTNEASNVENGVRDLHIKTANSIDVDEQSTNEDESTNSAQGEEEEEETADDIRAKAERMLLWANYQSTRQRSTTPISSSVTSTAGGGDGGFDEGSIRSKTGSFQASSVHSPSNNNDVSAADYNVKEGEKDSTYNLVSSIPASLNNRSLLDDDDASSLGSSSLRNDKSARSNQAMTGLGGGDVGNASGRGKMGKLFHKLKDVIDPSFDDEDYSDEESVDQRSLDS